MIKNSINRLLAWGAGLLAASVLLSACQLDKPEISDEEIYLRNFIMEFGLLDNDQDFNCALQSDITLNFEAPADEVTVIAKVGDYYYRVALYAQLSGTYKIPFDIPDCCRDIYILVDGELYHALPGGMLTVGPGRGYKVSKKAASRATETAGTATFVLNTASTTQTAVLSAGMDAGIASSSMTLGTGIELNGTLNFTGLEGNGTKMVTFKNSTADKFNGSNIPEVTFSLTIANGYQFVPNNVAVSAARRGTDSGNVTVKVGSTTVIDNQVINRHDRSLDLTTLSGTVTGVTATSSEPLTVKISFPTLNKEANVLVANLVITGTLSEVAAGGGSGDSGSGSSIDIPQDLVAILLTSGNTGKALADMPWIMAVEDLGTTDDFDFNDVIIRIEKVNANQAAIDLGLLQWQVIKDEEHVGLQPMSAPARATATGDSDQTTRLRITALAAGGTIPIWLHFRDPGNGKDWIICPNNPSSPLVEATEIASNEDINYTNEWHNWFADNIGYKDIKNTYNDRPSKVGKSVAFYTSSTYSMSQYCFIDYRNYMDALTAKGIDPSKSDWTTKAALFEFFTEESKLFYEYGFLLSARHPSHDFDDTLYLGIDMPGLPPEALFFPDAHPNMAPSADRRYGWEWPTERTDIRDVYPGFSAWVTSKTNNEWYLNPEPGLQVDDDYSNSLRYNRGRYINY